MTYEAIIGLEVHAQLLTESKLFCGCRAGYGEAPNSLTCPVCLGHPGTLPVLNRRAVEYAIKMILAVRGRINGSSVFARKNYFYPDLPKGYQISQYDRPLGTGGEIRIEPEGGPRVIGLTRIHLEEDAGKMIHPDGGEDFSRIDFNRCGVPLIEIVSEPDMRTPDEAHEFLVSLRRVLQYLGICSGDMEKGAFRCDANVSLRPIGAGEFGTRTELKNLNSFRAIRQALACEIDRQGALLDSGKGVVQETRLWDESSQTTVTMRGKEESEDYRYFPEPDLIPLEIGPVWVESIRAGLPELPDAKRDRFIGHYGLPVYDAGVLTDSRGLADYFEAVAGAVSSPKLAANWVMGDVLGAVNEQKTEPGTFAVTPEMLAELLQSIESDVISGKTAKVVFENMVLSGRRAKAIIEDKGLRQITDREVLEEIVACVLAREGKQVERYRGGKRQLFDYFVGIIMKETQGRANPELVNDILRGKLDG